MRRVIWLCIHWNMPLGLLRSMSVHTATVAGYLVIKASTRAINAGLASELGADPMAHEHMNPRGL